MMRPNTTQKPRHISPVVAAWEAGGQRAAFRAAERQVMRDINDARCWRWERPHIAMVVAKNVAWRWRAPPDDAPREPRFCDGCWEYYGSGHGKFFNAHAARAALRSEIAHRLEELRRRLPEKIRDQLVALGDMRNIRVVERALRWALAWSRTTNLSHPPRKDEIVARRKAVLIREVRKSCDRLDAAAERLRPGSRSREAKRIRQLMDRYEGGEQIEDSDKPDGGAS